MDASVSSACQLLDDHQKLTNDVRELQKRHRRILADLPSPPQALLALPLLPSPPLSPPTSPPVGKTQPQPSATTLVRQDLPPEKRAKAARYPNYVPEEETIRNDYSQRYVDSGEWPQNWVLGAEPERRFEEYPKQQRLLNLKKAAVVDSAPPPMHVHQSDLATLAPVAKFDVILIDPPFSSSFSWDSLETLPIPTLAADPSFIFLWVGSGAGDGLERGRAVLAKWGYRRCEDVVWIKTNNSSNNGPGTDPPTTSLLTRTKQHCLMGIRGTVRRSTDNWFVHCNVDTDVIIWEGDPTDPTRKPPEMYTLIENFCLGLKRLEVFGRPYSLRPGWVTAGDFELSPDIMDETEARSWDHEIWESELVRDNIGRPLVPMSQEIEILRPKSPHRPGHSHTHSNSSSGQFPSQGMGASHVLPNRPSMGRNTNGGFSGGVGLGIVNRPPPQPQMVGMNMGMGMGMPNMHPNDMNRAMMAGRPMMMTQPMQPSMSQPVQMSMSQPMQQSMSHPMMSQQGMPMGMGGMMGMPMMGMGMGMPQHFQPHMGMGAATGGFGGEMFYPQAGMNGMMMDGMGGMPGNPNQMGMYYNSNSNMPGGGSGMNMGDGAGMNHPGGAGGWSGAGWNGMQ